ncbi:hypothetical protein N7495_007019 [Penicillium taxi]|uniref:uncharacterized protein n=1 Tax=Penicillium taxi TaxID=168475 RepID=UPI0025454DB6|nr:uncharacterized protein N7495_007019 [Penicillium taxi]KAJ5895328.1 hypothetical protein N7495_007019 [Penicillium taxi]
MYFIWTYAWRDAHGDNKSTTGEIDTKSRILILTPAASVPPPEPTRNQNECRGNGKGSQRVRVPITIPAVMVWDILFNCTDESAPSNEECVYNLKKRDQKDIK